MVKTKNNAVRIVGKAEMSLNQMWQDPAEALLFLLNKDFLKAKFEEQRRFVFILLFKEKWSKQKVLKLKRQ